MKSLLVLALLAFCTPAAWSVTPEELAAEEQRLIQVVAAQEQELNQAIALAAEKRRLEKAAAEEIQAQSQAAAAQKNTPASEFSRYEQEFYLREAAQMYPQAANASSALSQKARKIYAAWKAAHDPRAVTASGMLDCYIAAAESLNIQPSSKHEQITGARKAAEIQAQKMEQQQHEERMALTRMYQQEEALRREQDRQAGAAAQQYIAQQNQYAAQAAASQQQAYAAAQPSVSPYSNASSYQRSLDAQAGIYAPPSQSQGPFRPYPQAVGAPGFDLLNTIELRGIPGSVWQHDINGGPDWRVTHPMPGVTRFER